MTDAPPNPPVGKTSVWMQELYWDRIADHLTRDDVALVPIGATEQHGLHAPLLLDTGWAIVVAEEAARRAGCLVTPPLHFGWSSGHMAYSGCIGLRAETLTAVAIDIAESLLAHGFRRIVFVNGNRVANLPPLEIAATTAVAAKSSGRPCGYMKTFVPLNIAKSGRVHAIALSSESAAYPKRTVTRPERAGCTRHVS